jgi:hypothetical protein
LPASTRFLVPALVAVVTLGVIAVAASSYVRLTYNGVNCYWPTIQREGNFGWTNDATGQGNGAFDTAATEWTDTPTKIILVEGTGSGIVTNNPDLGNDGMDGVTYYSCQSNGHFNGPVDSDLNSYYTYSYSTDERISVTAHEIGHSAAALQAYNAGCAAVEEIATSVRWGECGIDSPRQDDINGTNALYGSP